MAIRTEGKHTAEFILFEVGAISRDQITIAANAGDLVPGTVLGKRTATGHHVAYDADATDGSEVPTGILYAAARDSAATQQAVSVTRLAEVNAAQLTGLDANARTLLENRYVICR